MNFCKTTLLSGTFAFLIPMLSFAQSFEWDAGIHGFLDNREYFNKYSNDQTIFGSRLFAEAGLSVDGQSSFMAGFSYLYEFGTKGDSLLQPDITVYYRYKKSFEFFIGSFPRYGHINQPLILLTDTFNYYRPNIEGIYLGIHKKWGYENIWIDWTGRQSKNRKESFIIGNSGHIQQGILFLEHHLSFFHYALPLNPTPDEHIRDNGGLVATLGIDMSGKFIFDSLIFSSGIAYSYDRLRAVYDLESSSGWYSDILVKYKYLGLHSTLYWGEKHILINGDKLYQSGPYQRFDLFYQSMPVSRVSARIQFSVHLLPDVIDYSQMVSVYLNFGAKYRLKREVPGNLN